MVVKELGKAGLNLSDELWFVEGGKEKFRMNRRLVDTRPDVKSLKARYVKAIRKNTPSIRQRERREEFFNVREEYKQKLNELLAKVYEEIKEESCTYPLPLRRDKDFDHRGDWRYCLYEGRIYEFNRAGYSTDEMKDLITDFRKGD